MKNKCKDKRIILHIGIGKTGATSIQKMLCDNRSQLEELGCYYPDIGLYNYAHHRLANYRKDSLTIDGQKFYNEILEEFEKNDCSTLLLSSEQFCFCGTKYVQELGELFAKWPVKVLFYIRKQESLILSTFLQKLKEGESYHDNIESFFEKSKRAFDFNVRIKNWVSVFGVQSIDVRLYRKADQNYDVCHDFLAAINLNKALDNHIDFRSNKSLLPEFVELLSLVDSTECGKGEREKIVENMLFLSNKFKGVSDVRLLSDGLKDSIREYYLESNLEFASCFFDQDMAELFLK